MIGGKHQVVGQEIAKYISTQESQPTGWFHYSGLRMIVAGSSGSGKTLALDCANEILPENAQIAESSIALDVVRGDSIKELLDKLQDKELEYDGSPHIAFTLMSSDVAKKLARASNLPVFYLD
jgi:DNA polymerase III delta prime subunit